ncbi:MAG: DUF3025 domain-containing protein [Pseudomonadota bacterium]
MTGGRGAPGTGGAAGSPAIDWGASWLWGWRERGQQVASDVAQGVALHEALNRQRAAPLTFVPHAELPPGMPYEQFIHTSRRCPTRGNLHDFFNGLCWMRFPLVKARLNLLQAQQIAAQGVQPMRGPVRDALTVFDENAAFLDAPEPLWEALAARNWPRLFIGLRPLWAQAHLVLFGHALLEKLTQPRKPITAHVYTLRGMGGLAGADGGMDLRVSHSLDAATLAAKPFLPLPVLGVPGWWPANEDPSFYGDTAVFRQ